MGKSWTIADLLSKVTVKDALFSAAILAIGYTTHINNSILKSAIVETSREYAGNPGAGTATDIPFGFTAPEAKDEEE